MPSSGVQTCADRKSTRLNSSHLVISYAVFCLKKKNKNKPQQKSADRRGKDRGRPAYTTLLTSVLSRRTRWCCIFTSWLCFFFFVFFFFNDTATTEIYTLSLHDALPIWRPPSGGRSNIFSASRSHPASG